MTSLSSFFAGMLMLAGVGLYAPPAEAGSSFSFGYSSGNRSHDRGYGASYYNRGFPRHYSQRYYRPPVRYYYPPPPPRVVVVPPPRTVYVQPAYPPLEAIPTSPIYRSAAGQYCREYQTTVTVGGLGQPGYGTACLQPDGTWRVVN